MNTEPSIFKFHTHNIRTIVLNDEPWFVTKDVCEALDIQIRSNGKPNVVVATRNLDPDEKVLIRVRTYGGIQQLSCVSESGLYKLIMRSNKKEAKEFQNWVTKEVLPAIRKDGAYIRGEEKVATGELSEDEFVQKAIEILQRKTQRLTKERDEANSVIDLHLKRLTVDEWRALNNLYLSHSQKITLGQTASAYCALRNIPKESQTRLIKRDSKELEVHINVYPKAILDEAAAALNIVISGSLELPNDAHEVA